METSTNPAVVHSAAEMVPEIQWPVKLDVLPSLKRLSDTFHTCFEESAVRNGMDARATACIKAFGVLEMVTEHIVSPDLWTFPREAIKTTSPELESLVLMLRIKQPSKWLATRQPHLTQWPLRFIPAQHPPEYFLETVFENFYLDDVPEEGASFLADYLFCLNSFFMPTMASDRSLLDKRSDL
jgi:hypothetical protein